jgi:hypothetical protein
LNNATEREEITVMVLAQLIIPPLLGVDGAPRVFLGSNDQWRVAGRSI